MTISHVNYTANPLICMYKFAILKDSIDTSGSLRARWFGDGTWFRPAWAGISSARRISSSGLSAEAATFRPSGNDPIFFKNQMNQFWFIHRFQVTITSVNDPPELSLPPGKVLRLVKNTRKALSADLLTAVDPDNPPADLVYMVLNSKSDSDPEGKSAFFMKFIGTGA